MLNQDRSPPHYNPRAPMLLDPSIQRNLTQFSLITHGFGGPAIGAALTSFQIYLNESMKYLDNQLNLYNNVNPGAGAGNNSAHLQNSSSLIDKKKQIDLILKK